MSPAAGARFTDWSRDATPLVLVRPWADGCAAPVTADAAAAAAAVDTLTPQSLSTDQTLPCQSADEARCQLELKVCGPPDTCSLR